MLKYRLISFPILSALVALLFLWKEGGFYIYCVLGPLALGLAVYEAAAMVRNAGIPTYPKVTGVVAGFAALAALNGTLLFEKFSMTTALDLAVFGLAALLILPALVLAFRKEGVFQRIAGSAGIFLILGVPLLIAVNCWQIVLPFSVLPVFGGKEVNGLLFLIAVSKTMDTGGYIFGMLSNKFLPGGNHKIAPSVSPKKSWEGFFGGLVLTVLVACCFHWWGDLKIWWCVAAGVVLAVGSFFGDLTESAIKRRCDIKDSGSYIPGMGGALDVLDSFIYNGVLLVIMTVVFYGKF